MARMLRGRPLTFPTPARRALGMRLALALGAALLLLTAGCTASTPNDPGALSLQLGVSDSPAGRLTAVQIIILLTVLSVVPALLMLMTSFTRIIIVLSFIRSAVGVQQLPPNQVLLGLAVFLTIFIMAPAWNEVNREALQPYLKGDIEQGAAYQQAMHPLRRFMLKQTREKDIALFLSAADTGEVKAPEDVPDQALIPAFIISELKTGFQMGFLVFVPFLIIDLVVSSTLMSMGMMMLPPVVVSLPFKVLLFVLVDGWYLITRSLLLSFA